MLITVFYIFVSASALLFAIYHFSGIRKQYNKTAHIPGPLTLPLVGTGLYFLGNSEHVLNKITEFTGTYGSPTRIAFGPRVFLITTNPEQINTVLHSNVTTEKDRIYKFFNRAIGNGLLTSEHKIWRTHRKLIQPKFASRILKNFITTFHKNSLSLVRAVENHIECPEFQVSSHILATLFSNMCETSIGVSLETEREKVTEFLKTIDRGMELLFERIVKVWLHVETIFNFSQNAKNINECIKHAHNFTDSVIQQKRKIMQENRLNAEDYDFEKKVKSTLEMMLELSEHENKFSDKELRDHSLSFIIASYDSTLCSLNFLFLMLASYPDIQDRVYKEIFDIYGEDDPEFNPVQYDDLSKLVYLERVIKETLRLFPPVPFVARDVSEDFQLDGYSVPKNCSIITYILGVHRNETNWPDPLKFDPDRFLPERMSQRHPRAFMPFSYGPRDCIGRIYSMMSMKTITVNFLRKYVLKKDKILPIKDIRLKMDLTLKPVDSIKLRIEKRGKSF